MKCKLSLLLTSFVCALAILISPMSVSAAEAGSGGRTWNGDLFFLDDFSFLPLNYVYVESYDERNGETVPIDRLLTYKNTASTTLQVIGTVGTFLNGVAKTSYTFTPVNTWAGSGSLFGVMKSNSYDGITISGTMNTSNVNEPRMEITVTFDNFEITSPNMYFPIELELVYTHGVLDAPGNHPNAILVSIAGTDWTDSIRMYTSVADLPGTKGFLGRAFDSLKTHITSLFNGLKQNDDKNTQAIIDGLANQDNGADDIISNQNANNQAQINQGITNSQNEINQSIENTQNQIEQSKENADKIANGYENDKTDTITSDIETNFSSLEDAEAGMIDFAQQSLRGFTIPVGGIKGLADGLENSMGVISAMMQATFEASEAFGVMIIATFTLVIVSMVVGLTKFMR